MFPLLAVRSLLAQRKVPTFARHFLRHHMCELKNSALKICQAQCQNQILDEQNKVCFQLIRQECAHFSKSSPSANCKSFTAKMHTLFEIFLQRKQASNSILGACLSADYYFFDSMVGILLCPYHRPVGIYSVYARLTSV